MNYVKEKTGNKRKVGLSLGANLTRLGWLLAYSCTMVVFSDT